MPRPAHTTESRRTGMAMQMHHVSGMESMDANEYRAALQRKLAAVEGEREADPPATPPDNYMDFMQKFF